jgi:hypothetical protein
MISEIPQDMQEQKMVKREPLCSEDSFHSSCRLQFLNRIRIEHPGNKQEINVRICLSVYMDNYSREFMMADESGRFKQGMWITGEISGSEVKQPEIIGKEPENLIEERIAEVSKNLSRNIDDIFQLTRDLLTTNAGHRHIEHLINTAGSRLERTVNDLFGHSADPENEGNGSSDKTHENIGKNDE